ncbi:MAG: hypothetical protein ACKOKE_04025 [Actinomycetota bacterium]
MEEPEDLEGLPPARRRPHPLLLVPIGAIALAIRPIVRAWRSQEPLEHYALVHLASVAGDAMVAIALADSVFFAVPVGQATSRVAAYLLLTMAPLAVAAPLLVPLLDRAGPRRAIAVAAALGRAAICIVAAPHVATELLFPAAFALLVLGRVHGITKNGLTVAYAGDGALVRANARLGRFAAGGAVVGAIPAFVLLHLGGSGLALRGAAVAYALGVLLVLRLPRPSLPAGSATASVGRRGAVPELAAPAIGAAGLRAANGFLLFALAFALRRSGEPAWWYGALAAAGTAGALLGDVIAPRIREGLREEAVVVACVLGAGIGSVVTFAAFSLPGLAVFALAVGAATELGRLAFQSLMQRAAPGGAHGRVFVRYEVAFQLAWVAGALVPALLELGLREAFLGLAGVYLLAALGYLVPDLRARRGAPPGSG